MEKAETKLVHLLRNGKIICGHPYYRGMMNGTVTQDSPEVSCPNCLKLMAEYEERKAEMEKSMTCDKPRSVALVSLDAMMVEAKMHYDVKADELRDAKKNLEVAQAQVRLLEHAIAVIEMKETPT
jgi:hypothetical protein